MVFIEYPVDAAPWSRNSRFWAAHGGGSVTLPEIIVDSGHQYTNGPEDYYNVYKSMVDAELARPPQAAIDAAWWREGDRVRFYARITNLAGVSLSTYLNDATVHAVVYEDAHVADTDRFARAAVYTGISSDLAPGAAADFSLVTPDLVGVDWDRLHFLVLADYRPAGAAGPYDMLQAAAAVPAAFDVTPSAYGALIDQASPADRSFQVRFSGPDWLPWSATTDAPWLAVTPASGTIASPPIVTLTAGMLSPGWQQGHVYFTTTGGPAFSDQIPVEAYLGPLAYTHLPLIRR